MFRWPALGLVLCVLLLATSANAQMLASIKASRHLDCGAVQSVDDWNGEDVHGDLSALGAEICRAVAVAILGDSAGLSVHAFPAEPEALGALKSGKVQLVAGVSPSATVATQFGVGFGLPIFYDSQRIMVARQSGVADLASLHDKVICALDMSPPERTLRDELTARHVAYALMSHSEQGELDAAVAVRRCAGTGMESRLAQSRANFHAHTSDFVFLPERLALLLRSFPPTPTGIRPFGRIIDWTISALIEAEALGITKDNVAEARKTRRHAGRSTPRPRLRDRSGSGSGARLGRQGHRRHRQLRGDLRAHDGQAISTGTRPECALDAGRSHGADANEVKRFGACTPQRDRRPSKTVSIP